MDVATLFPYFFCEVIFLITPNSLYPGAQVALVAPASSASPDSLAPAVRAVEALGLQPVVYPSCHVENRHGYFASSDAQRAQDLQAAFADPTIAGVLCIRGGYGAHRLLPLLDLDAIARTPKYFSGYSDVTALHTAFNQCCGLVTYHTIMPATEYYEPVDDYSMEQLRRALFGFLTGPLENPQGQPMATLQAGAATGTLCGGNLSLLAASMGTPWEIDTRGKILFLEDINEKYYRIDSMLTQLRNGGKLDDCAGIVLGYWTDCTPEYPERTLSLEEVFTELLVPSGKPILANVACGHDLPCLSLPLGAHVSMDAGAQTLEVLEP